MDEILEQIVSKDQTGEHYADGDCFLLPAAPFQIFVSFHSYAHCIIIMKGANIGTDTITTLIDEAQAIFNATSILK